MKPICVFDPTTAYKKSLYRGSGRIIKTLKENISDKADFVNSLSKCKKSQVLLIPFWNLYSLTPLRKRIAGKQVLTIFDTIPLKYPTHFPAGIKGRLSFLANRWFLKYADEIIVISHHVKKDVIDYLGIDRKKVHVVYPTTSKIFFDSSDMPLISRKKTKPYCLYVGDVNWNKNLVNLAKAIKIAKISCLFVGKPFKKKALCKSYIKNLDNPWTKEFKEFLYIISDSNLFVFKSYVSDKELLVLYKNALCNILVSRDEGFGLSYLEASTQGCPSILSDTPVFREIADEAAFFVKPDNPSSIANAILLLLNNKKTYFDIQKKAFIRSKKFSPFNFRKKLLDILIR